jgi:hypothetical protein
MNATATPNVAIRIGSPAMEGTDYSSVRFRRAKSRLAGGKGECHGTVPAAVLENGAFGQPSAQSKYGQETSMTLFRRGPGEPGPQTESSIERGFRRAGPVDDQ